MAKIRKPSPLPVELIQLPAGASDAPGYPGNSGQVVVRQVGEDAWELVWGRAGLLRPSGGKVSAWVVQCAPEAASELLSSDVALPHPWHALVGLCAALRALQLPNHAVAALLDVTPAEVSRLTKMRDACSTLQDAVAAGSISPGHARLLAMLPIADQPHWTRKAVAHGWSVRQLEGALSDERAGVVRREAPDTASFLTRLGEVLGTRAVLEGGQLRLACFSVEEAKGLMERLAQGPEVQETAAKAPMWLCVPATNNDQLYALTGHLISE